ncbi:MAG TPA: adenosine-specific kinase, partial [Nitrospiria bacterium]
LIRASGTDTALVELAKKNALALSAGHVFIIFLRDVFPINVLNAVKTVQEVCAIYCASANPVEVILAETDQGRGVMGVIDGLKSKGVETDQDVVSLKDLLRRFGYKA